MLLIPIRKSSRKKESPSLNLSLFEMLKNNEQKHSRRSYSNSSWSLICISLCFSLKAQVILGLNILRPVKTIRIICMSFLL